MRPEKIDDKFVSYATGQLQSASPLDKWAIEACEKVKDYNSIPEEKRPNHSAVLKGTDNDDNYLLDCFGDEYGNGDEVWVEMIPENADNYKEMSQDQFDSNDKLKIIVAAYHHVEMEIVDIDTEPLTAWLESNYPQLLQYLRDNKLINEDINANKNDITLSRNRKIYYCHKCQNYMEIEANNAKHCPICGSSQLTFVKARNGVKA